MRPALAMTCGTVCDDLQGWGHAMWRGYATSGRCCSATLIRIWEDAANLLLSAPLGVFARTAARMLHIAAQTCIGLVAQASYHMVVKQP